VNVPGIWRETHAALVAVNRWRGTAQLADCVPRGDGPPVLLIPGYLAGDRSLEPLASWLRKLGYAPQHAAIAVNVDCATRTATRLVERLKTVTAAHDDRAVIVGHSLGGVLGRVLAVRHPDLVRGVVCLGSPLVDVTAVNPLLWANVRFMGLLGDLGLPGVLTRKCLTGACCAETRRLSRAPFPDEIGLLSIYSRSDGIVDWRACLDPDAEHVEVNSSHIGMAVNTAVYRVLAEALAGLGDEGRRPALAQLAA
jgi:pimeloyl-ACP methyl ester carboxylesterase